MCVVCPQKQARAVVSEMLGRWDDSTCTIISDNSEPAHVMVYAECLHAKVEMQWEADKGRLDELVERLRSAVGAHCAEDILRFDASRFQDRLPTQAYCKPCGEFQKGSKGLCPNQESVPHTHTHSLCLVALNRRSEHPTHSSFL